MKMYTIKQAVMESSEKSDDDSEVESGLDLSSNQESARSDQSSARKLVMPEEIQHPDIVRHNS